MGWGRIGEDGVKWYGVRWDWKGKDGVGWNAIG